MIIKVNPDKEKVKSILNLIKDGEDFVSTIDMDKFSTSATENYYEIIKELASCLILLDGLKSVGENAHRDLIDSLLSYKEFSEADIVFLNDLRIKRNNSSYEGKKIDPSYLKNNRDKILNLIKKIKSEIKSKL